MPRSTNPVHLWPAPVCLHPWPSKKTGVERTSLSAQMCLTFSHLTACLSCSSGSAGSEKRPRMFRSSTAANESHRLQRPDPSLYQTPTALRVKWSPNEPSRSSLTSADGPTEGPRSLDVCRRADKPCYRWASSCVNQLCGSPLSMFGRTSQWNGAWQANPQKTSPLERPGAKGIAPLTRWRTRLLVWGGEQRTAPP